MLVCFLFASIFAWGQEPDAESLYEPVDLSVVFDRTYSASFPALYAPPSVVFLPMSPLFDFLKVPNTVSADGQVVKGFFEIQSNSFVVDLTKKTAQYNGKTFSFAADEAVMDLGILYLKTTLYKRVFGFDLNFNERALSIEFSSPFELPVFKLMKLEKKRDALRAEGSDEAVYDTVLLRDYHLFRGHMLDWSVGSTQMGGTVDSRFAIGYGAEILGGETNIFTNYSSSTGFTLNQQQYSWRWADNFSKLVRQVTLGRVPASTISTLNSPMDGFMVTNALTTIRKALGTYLVADYTDPDWVVELYLNNQLISYTRADASGYFSFKVPIVYGTSMMTLRYYGPNGEIKSDQRTYSMPFNLLPKGEFEYQVNGGKLLDSTTAKFAKASFTYGLTRNLTVSTGLEYLSTITTSPSIPFFNFTYQPHARLLLTGEYASQVRTKFTMNLSLPSNIVLDAAFSQYVPGQKAIVYNYLQERSLSLNIPFRLRNWSTSLRSSFRQNIYPEFAFTSGELTWNNNFKNYSMIFTNYINSSAANALNLYANLTVGTKVKNLNLRASTQYNYVFKQLLSVRAEADRRIFKNGFASLKLENNFLSNSQSVSLSFRYELPFMMTNASASMSNKSVQFSEGASGSFAFNSGGKYVYVTNHNSVGRSGVSIMPFVDVNFNGVHDQYEPFSKGLKVRSSGGQVLAQENDSIIRIVGLEPFVDYNLILDESGFDNIALRASRKNMKIITDPNQFKVIQLPILPMAEITGGVLDENGNGIGRIIIRIVDHEGHEVTKMLTESDGYFSYIGFKPGDYKVFVDSSQLSVLKYKAAPVYATVVENADGDVINVGDIKLVKIAAPSAAVPIDAPAPVPSERLSQDSLSQYVVLFALNSSNVESSYLKPLSALAEYLNRPSHSQYAIDVQGYTDTNASSEFNFVLSQRRAQAVKQLLVHYGVNPDRLKTSSFGKTRPLNEEMNEAEKAQNRRVMFKLISINQDAEMPFKNVLDSGNISLSLLKPTIQNLLSKNELSTERHMERYELAPDWCLMYEKDGLFMFQVAAFGRLEDAMHLADQLKAFRPDKLIVINQGVFVKVQLGFYSNYDEALQDAASLYSKGLIKR